MAAAAPAQTHTQVLKTLRRHDPRLKNLLLCIKFTAAYELSEAMQWKNSEVGGPLFIVERSPESPSAPKNKIIILNRKSLDNFELDIVPNMTIESNTNFVYVESRKGGKVFAFWFYDLEDQKACYDLIVRLSATAPRSSRDGMKQAGLKHSDRKHRHQKPKNTRPLASSKKPEVVASSSPNCSPLSATEPDVLLSPDDLLDISMPGKMSHTESRNVRQIFHEEEEDDDLFLAVDGKEDGVSNLLESRTPKPNVGRLSASRLMSKQKLRDFLHSLVEDPEVFDAVYAKYLVFSGSSTT
eukprot:jgi/Bigna1/84771/estExt_fgenesh1_pg.C_10026